LVEIEILRQVWVQSFYLDTGQVRWRAAGNIPPAAQMISSPYDLEARYATKRDTAWVGYKVHLTETCETDYPNLITHVETTPATTPDVQVVETIHADLATQNRTPTQHLVDTGYVEADGLVDSQARYGIDLLGPTMPDTSWQARAGQGFDAAHFQVDGAAQRVICPQGHPSQSWTPALDHHQRPVVYVRFAPVVCRACPCQTLCTRAKSGARELTLWPPAQHAALQVARQRQHSAPFKADYAIRAGIEGTISQAAYTLGMRRARYIGLAKTHLQHLATAAAINLARVMAWLAGTPRSQTRRSPFAALAA
jgi:transposase